MKSTILKPAIVASILASLLWSTAASAFTFTPIAEGTLPDGQVVSQFQVTFEPGETFPWHLHPGPLYGVVVSGALAEDVGCGNPLEVHSAGQAFFEEPGKVHQVSTSGSAPVTISFQAVTPSCFNNYQVSVFVSGPSCEGESGKSKLEEIPACQ
jgi:quercetin dioxygenase-like cupin family protein